MTAHFAQAGHCVFLSVEHAHLYCTSCEDFVFNQYLDAAIALHLQHARAQRRRFTTSLTLLDPPVSVDAPPQPRSPSPLRKKPRLLAYAQWTPTDQEVRSIAAHVSLFPLGKTVRPPVGLYNLGNSCYMNSVLQAFLNAPPLRNFFLADLHRASCARNSHATCFACAIEQLVCDSCFVIEARAFGREKRVDFTSALPVPFLVPHTVLDIVWRNAEHLASYAQHDAHEFLLAALNLLNTHCKNDANENDSTKEKGEPVLVELKLRKAGVALGRLATDSHKRLASNLQVSTSRDDDNSTDSPVATVSPVTNMRADAHGQFNTTDGCPDKCATSIVQSLFKGTLQSDVICRVCGNSSPTLEKFYDISLDVDKLAPPQRVGVLRRGRASSPANDIASSGGAGGAGMANGGRAHGGYDHRGGASSRGKSDSKGRNSSAAGTASASADSANGYGEGSGGAENQECLNSLHECLNRFTEPELLGAGNKTHCASCGCRQEAMKQMSIRTLPPIVCFHFKRFEQSIANARRNEMVKIDTAVEFPADGLDLSAFQTSEILSRRYASSNAVGNGVDHGAVPQLANAKPSKGKSNGKEPNKATSKGFDRWGYTHDIRENEQGIYDLFAVVDHLGKIDSGHYTSLVRREGAWFQCDDEKVSSVKDVQKVVRSEKAYLVFYVQRYANIQFTG